MRQHIKKESLNESKRGRNWRGKDNHHLVWAPQWWAEGAVVRWGLVCGAAQLEQQHCTGGPHPSQLRNVEEEVLGTMCNVPKPFWVPPIFVSFCFQAGENRKSSRLRLRRTGFAMQFAEGAAWGSVSTKSTTVIVISLSVHEFEL